MQPRGLVNAGTTPSAGTVTARSVSSTSVATADAASGYTFRLDPGTYQLTATVADGLCASGTVVITLPATTVNLSCHDGISTD